ncbi:MAG: hypothetical protein AAB500_00100 [Patescibacteria group bacterium]
MTRDAKKILKYAALSVFSLVIVIYAYFRSTELIWGVKVKNVVLQREESMLKISGNAKNAVHLALNGREISIDQAGNWNEALALLPGYNLLDINAKDKFGHESQKSYQLIN